jgi:predicted transcriptional regulator
LQDVKKNEIPTIQKEHITAVCIDDFSFKKGHTYGTIMINIPSRRVIDMIDTRAHEPVQEWLKTYPSLRFVSRDGSITFKSAISQANENIIQISDRFHLLKGLTDAAKKYITGYFKANIALPVSVSHYDDTETSDYWVKNTKNMDFPTRLHICATNRKMKLVEEARDLREEGYASIKIAQSIGVTVQTVKEYLKEDFDPCSSGYNTTSQSKIKPYADDIKTMLSKGNTFKEIESFIRQKGYDGSASTIRMFATRERKLLKEVWATGGYNVEKIERKWLISLLYKPIDKVKKLSQEQLDKIIDENPVIGKVFDIVKSFKETLFSKKEAALDKWIEEALLLGIGEINSFVGGITRDMEAVKNAIKYDYSNGLAEGSVNKLKVIKRIMYGRCSFDLLKNKVLWLELKRNIN